jgi:hypothetical protein
MKPDPVILCVAGVCTPVACYLAVKIANDVVASRPDAPNQNFMVLSFLVLMLSIVVGVCLFSFGLARLFDGRQRRRGDEAGDGRP